MIFCGVSAVRCVGEVLAFNGGEGLGLKPLGLAAWHG
jgi:hypothetical protein